MGFGSWDVSSFTSYSSSVGKTILSNGKIDLDGLFVSDVYKTRSIDKDLDPLRFSIRECCDTEEHPQTIPVILAIDVTGSMGETAMEVSSSLNVIMTDLYKDVPDVEFSVMGIGDLECDSAPIQMSQFESDVRIAEHLDKIYFEGGGGANAYESYSAAWYMGLYHTRLDCWNRNKKGIIITFGDETINPSLPYGALNDVTNDGVQFPIKTEELYNMVSEKYEIYHVFVNHSSSSARRYKTAKEEFEKIIGEDHFYSIDSMNEISEVVTHIIKDAANKQSNNNENDEYITW